MKRIQQNKLFFREGNSDKVYEIDLCELSPESYIVNFRYGKRGTVLKEGTKTPEAVSRDKAEEIFSALEDEKRKKGYQTETETFVELPSLEHLEPRSVQGAILQRLQDAVEGRNSFHTQWKTSRVIWRAGYLHVTEAIPFIIKLAGKGDEMQRYAALWALGQLKAVQAVDLLRSFAFQPKQKTYLRHIACEGLLNILEGDNLAKLEVQLLERLAPEARYHIETANTGALAAHLEKDSQQQKVAYFPDLYLVCRVRPDLLPSLHQAIAQWPFQPPYFKNIRAIYKLAQARKDATTLAALSYRFEKERAMFTRKYALDSDERQMIVPIGEAICTGKELKNADSRIAFSQFTKTYFQENSIRYMKNLGNDAGAKEYLRLAVATLLQYTEADYTPAEKLPVSYHGSYDHKNKLYSFTLVDYPECADSLLLSTILFGNDPARTRQSNLKFTTGYEIVTSRNYYYSPDRIIKTTVVQLPQQQQPAQPQRQYRQESSDNGVLGAAIHLFKNLFGKKSEPVRPVEQPKPVEEPVEITSIPPVQAEGAPEVPGKDRLEWFPGHWDAMPEAYIQLLMQAQMNLVHLFAYNNLTNRADCEDICRRFDESALLRLLYSPFAIPNQLGFETLEKRKDEFYMKAPFVGEVLDSNSVQARAWTRVLVDSNPQGYTGDLDFMFRLLFNCHEDNRQWIASLLDNTAFTDDRLQALVGKTVAELLPWENNARNNKMAGIIIDRINRIASQQVPQLSWNVVEQLMSSPLDTNTLLASKVVVQRSQKAGSTDIPLSLTSLFLENTIPDIRRSGIDLMSRYPDHFLAEHADFLLAHTDSSFEDVAGAFIGRTTNMLRMYPDVGKKALHHLVYALIRKEKFENAHRIFSRFVLNELKVFWETGLTPRDITKLIHAQYREGQLTGYELLKNQKRTGDFTIGQIVSFGNHEILAFRQWCWNYFTQNIARIRYERDKALAVLDAKWDDTRAFAFHFFKTQFTTADWDPDTLIAIVDSIRPDVENFGKELIMQHFDQAHAMEYLTKLSEHPSTNVQLMISGYLSEYVAGNTFKLVELEHYFRSVLMRVNKGRVAKDRVFRFLHREALQTPDAAEVIVPLLDDVSAQSTVQDKATCIHILTEIKSRYPHLDMHLTFRIRCNDQVQ